MNDARVCRTVAAAIVAAFTCTSMVEGSAAMAQEAPASAASVPAGLPVWTLDATHTFVHWEVLHMSTSTIRGRFGKANGSVQFDPKAQKLDLSVAVETDSVSSGVPILDALLKGKAMLDVGANPQAFFTSKQAAFDGESPREIRGEFTLRGVSQPLTLRALRWHCGLNPLFRRTVCGGDFEGEILRSAFGITHSLPFVADTVKLLVEVEAISP